MKKTFADFSIIVPHSIVRCWNVGFDN